MDQLTGEYTRSCAYIEFGLQDNVTAIPVAVGPTGQELYSSKTKALFASVFDRLSRYPILLKETERYYEVSPLKYFHFGREGFLTELYCLNCDWRHDLLDLGLNYH